MATRYDEVTVASIDQGGFLEEGEKAFSKVQKQVIAHAKKYGACCGEVALKVKISVDADGFFKLVTDVSEKMPKKPSRITPAFVNEGQDGSECLFTQAGGIETGEKQQMQMQICEPGGPPIAQPNE